MKQVNKKVLKVVERVMRKEAVYGRSGESGSVLERRAA